MPTNSHPRNAIRFHLTLAYIEREKERNQLLNQIALKMNRNGANLKDNSEVMQSYNKHIFNNNKP